MTAGHWTGNFSNNKNDTSFCRVINEYKLPYLDAALFLPTEVERHVALPDTLSEPVRPISLSPRFKSPHTKPAHSSD